MKLCIVLVIAGIACAAPVEQRACRDVESERILARDLAAAIPAFRALAPQLPVAFAPLPGSRRIMQVSELVSLARRNSIEIVEMCRNAVPRGRIEFPRDRLGMPAAAGARTPVL